MIPVVKDRGSTALAADVTTTNGTSVVVVSAAALIDSTRLSGGQVITVDDEQMLVTGVSTNTLTVTRAYGGTTAATHASGAVVSGNWVASTANTLIRRLNYGDMGLLFHGASALDSGPYAHTVTAVAAPGYVAGPTGFGNCANLNGSSQWFTCAGSSAFDLAGDWWMSARFQVASVPSISRLIARGGVSSADGDWGFGFGTVWGGGTKFGFSAYSTGLWDLHSPAVTVSTGVYHHAVCSHFAGSIRYYMDGALLGTQPFVLSGVPVQLVNTNTLYIGAQSGGEQLTGYIGEVIICRGTAGPFTGPTYTVPAAPYAY